MTRNEYSEGEVAGMWGNQIIYCFYIGVFFVFPLIQKIFSIWSELVYYPNLYLGQAGPRFYSTGVKRPDAVTQKISEKDYLFFWAS